MTVTFDPITGSVNLSEKTKVPVDTWIRASDWLPMPTVLETEQKFVGLLPVFDAPENRIALSCEGAYTVDWGDGTIENYNSGAIASHLHVYANTSSATQCSRGYRQVLVTVTPQAGQILNFIDLNVSASATNFGRAWLDVIISMPQSSFQSQPPVRISLANLIERVQILNLGTANNLASLFDSRKSLKSVLVKNVSNVSDFAYMFSNCSGLVSVAIESGAALTDVQYMFNGCINLTRAPMFNTENVAYMNGMFDGCDNLAVVPLYNTSNAISMSSMFRDCYSIQNMPHFDTSKVTNMQNMFVSNWMLKKVPLFNTVLVQNFAGMFDDCRHLESVPLFNMSSALFTWEMFKGCFLLRSVPAFNTSSVTDMASMFLNCASLATVPVLDVSGANCTAIFSGCYGLSVAPALDLSGATNISNIFLNCRLRASNVTGTQLSISYSSNLLSRDAIVAIFNNLPTVAASPVRNINVALNPGSANLTLADRTIATDKGWTVTW